MANVPKTHRRIPGRDPEKSVGSLASEALSMLVARRVVQSGATSERFMTALHDAVCGNDPAQRDRVVREMLHARIDRCEIADVYIPEIARRMGEEWCDDTMSFAEVSIGVARLQGLLRDLTEDWSVEQRMYDNALNIVVLMLADDYHTLGPMLVTSQLRRLGASVRLLLGRSEAEVRVTISEQAFDLILISVAHVERLAATGDLVRTLRGTVLRPAPIVIGGPAIEFDPEGKAKTLTGADHVSNDIREVLGLCGLIDRTAASRTPPPPEVR